MPISRKKIPTQEFNQIDEKILKKNLTFTTYLVVQYLTSNHPNKTRKMCHSSYTTMQELSIQQIYGPLTLYCFLVRP